MRVVYAPAPPVASAAKPAEESGSLVVEEPLPPEPAEVAPTESSSPRTAPRRRRPRTETPAASETTTEAVEPLPVEVPTLEPRGSPEQQTALRQQILDLQERLRQRSARFDRLRLSSQARKTLDDARTFLAQSERALLDGDLGRAHNLANKASLLVSALEQEQ